MILWKKEEKINKLKKKNTQEKINRFRFPIGSSYIFIILQPTPSNSNHKSQIQIHFKIS